MVDVADVLGTARGCVVAPAGCGKTELIVASVAQQATKPSLLLTHTTAGVAVLRARLKRLGVPSSAYRLNTIAGWALALISMFPERAGYAHDVTQNPDYVAIQNAIGTLCKSGHINSEIRATYGRLFVDEYQDCTSNQHGIVSGLARVLPTVVFGDPMQCIFNFRREPFPDWTNDVMGTFPLLGTLQTPWRWNRVGANNLGVWLLGARQALQNSHQIDLRTCPGHVTWYPLTNDFNQNITTQVRVQYELSRQYPSQSILIIGDSIQATSRHNYASRAHGVSVVEPVDFGDVVASARSMNSQVGAPLLQASLDFLSSVMTNVGGTQIQTRIQSILNRRNRTEPTPAEMAALAVNQSGGYAEVIAFFKVMSADTSRRIYRDSAYYMMLEALKSVVQGAPQDLATYTVGLREQRRHSGRDIAPKSIGSTLLLKGLEADHVIILDADNPKNRMSREHLYVALSRGARTISAFARRPVIP